MTHFVALLPRFTSVRPELIADARIALAGSAKGGPKPGQPARWGSPGGGVERRGSCLAVNVFRRSVKRGLAKDSAWMRKKHNLPRGTTDCGLAVHFRLSRDGKGTRLTSQWTSGEFRSAAIAECCRHACDTLRD